MLTVGSVFSGIGGFELGLERAGMRCLWQCELDPFCERVLAKHWPDVLRVRDVRDVRAGDVPWVDVICGGAPCQPVSDAGAKRAQQDERWLWPEYARLIADLRPRYALLENVRGLFGRGFGDVLGDLAALRYDAEWGRISAARMGAPHGRPRLWLVAYPSDGLRHQGKGQGPRVFGEGWWRHAGQPAAWQAEPDVGRVADGLSARLDNARLNALGNSLVPQIAEWIGRRIIDFEEGGLADAA